MVRMAHGADARDRSGGRRNGIRLTIEGTMREHAVERALGTERRGRTGLREVSPPHSPLESLIRLIEHELPEMRGSVLLLDDDGQTLRHGAAPSLPPRYCDLIDGSRIGPVAGSCGTAAFRREQVIVSDITTDPLWADYKDLALPFGLRACWSTPIIDQDDAVL